MSNHAVPVRLAPRERQVMDALYRLGEATVADLVEAIPEDLSYSAVRAVLRALRGKGRVSWRESGPRYVYRPSIPRDEARARALEHVVRTYFDGSAAAAAAQLLRMEGPQPRAVHGGAGEPAGRGSRRPDRGGRRRKDRARTGAPEGGVTSSG